MFTGIIETTGVIKDVVTEGTNKSFWVESSLTPELKVDQSLAHEGVCLTVESISGHLHKVTAVLETLKKTNLNNWEPGTCVNLERCMQLSARLDGHLVQGHVDTIGTCTRVIEEEGSWVYTFSFDPSFGALLVEKGSIALNGTSLTVFNVTNTHFSVTIIPYTYEHTSISNIRRGSDVNLEFDIIGKYVLRSQNLLINK
jgi:riboflavin synthase